MHKGICFTRLSFARFLTAREPASFPTSPWEPCSATTTTTSSTERKISSTLAWAISYASPASPMMVGSVAAP